jgi:hypothetical protein
MKLDREPKLMNHNSFKSDTVALMHWIVQYSISSRICALQGPFKTGDSGMLQQAQKGQLKG